MYCLYRNIIIGVSALHGILGFAITGPTRAHGNIATLLGLSNNDDATATGTSSIVSAALLPSWYEKALLDSLEDIEEINDQLESLEDIELQELCAFGRTFDIDQTATKRRSMKRHPKKHKHLFRYSPDIMVACWLATTTNLELLESCGFTKEDIQRMSSEFPKLLKMDAKNMLAPKLRFLVKVLCGGSGDIGNGLTHEASEGEEFVPHNLCVSRHVRERLPAKAFFGSRLETSIAPRHAYLVLHRDSLPYGKELLDYSDASQSNEMLLEQFLGVCSKKPDQFADLCNQWQTRNIANRSANINYPAKVHTAASVEAMDDAFCDGIVPFARNEVTAALDILGCTAADMVSLLLDHGANYAEHDDWGSTVLHWAAGTGNLDGVKALVETLEQDEEAMEGDAIDVLWSTCASCYSTKDQATPLHWASAGVNHTHFGCIGHVAVCSYLLDKAGEKKKSLANSITASGNTPFMWACWSGSLDVAKFLVSEGDADPFVRNDGGFTAAHWASSGGHIDVCRFLIELGLPFVGEGAENKVGQTPLDCAKSYERSDVVDWVATQNLKP
ncbi:hypothetical protein ACHAXR_009675 [Thalassiosira sp. AJA248-18]